MQDFKTFIEQDLGASAQDAINAIKKLDGRLTSSQWDELTALIMNFSPEKGKNYTVGWNLSGTSYGPPDQPPKQDPRTLQPS